MDGWLSWLRSEGGERWLVPAIAALRIVMIFGSAWIVIAVLQKVVRAARLYLVSRLHGEGAAKRAETIGRAIRDPLSPSDRLRRD